MTAQDLALFCIVCLSPAVIAVGLVCVGLALVRGAMP